MIKLQYSIVVFTASVELFMCALPADNLMHMVTFFKLTNVYLLIFLII